ncbi:MAG: poly-gamma-glutamate biosynthesis protein PgsC [Planctomycetales bacterium]|nr:poly-gamma-glutamate biosynthesis protein PgsC [Planctomycetales bacterium]
MDSFTVAIGLGLIVSLMFTETFGLAAGGMIVPGYFATQFGRPLDIVLTFAVALLTYLVVSAVANFAIVYGRRRIVLMLLVGFVIGHSVRLLVAAVPAINSPTGSCIAVIGYIIPGLIALWIDRQGPAETVGTVLTASAVVRLCLVMTGMEVLV